MSETQNKGRPPLAVVGISALFPGSSDLRGFWRDILSGRDLIKDVPPNYWLIEDYYDADPRAPDKTYGKRGAFLDKIDFNPLEFGIPPASIPSTDTCQLLSLIVAKRVLQDASQGELSHVNPERISVILGAAAGMELLGEMASRLQRPVWVKALREHGVAEDEVQAICDRISGQYVPWTEATFPGLLGNVITGRIANRFDLGGTNCTTDAACASSLSALSMAVNELYLGDSDMVITGGVDTTNDPFLYMCFSKTPALSFSGDCRPFSDAADGTMLGEGLGMVALRRLEDAERDGDRIYALIRGVGTSSDGRAKSVYAPRPEGQARALARTYELAGYSPSTVELVEAHGTGTMAGDIAEFTALKSTFEASGRNHRQWCALGSIKSQFGHTKGSAGVAGLIKAVLALHHKALPPIIKVDRPDPAMEIQQSPFYLNTATRPWIRDGQHPRRASVSSFGFGGTNFHVALEEYKGSGQQAMALRTFPAELVLLCKDDPQALLSLCQQTIEDLEGDCPGLLPCLARQTQEAFSSGAGPARLALVAADEEALRGRLEQAVKAISQSPDKALSLPGGTHYSPGSEPLGEVAFLFPGQGSQYLQMGADLALGFDQARGVWDLAAGIPLSQERTLHQVVFPLPVFTQEEEKEQARLLTATQWAQPALGAASLATYRILQEMGLSPSHLGGHSFGEVTALCAAGVLEPQDLLRVARKRGELMAAASEIPGAMLAVVRPPERLPQLLEEWGEEVVIANHNSPKQVVLSGSVEAVEETQQRLKNIKVRSRLLPVSTAFHSPLVSDSAEPFMEFLEQVPFGAARAAVYSNSEAAPYPEDPRAMRELLARQIARPVRFADEIAAMYDAGARTFVEVGPGSVLSGLVGQCLAGRPHLAISTDRKGKHGVLSLWDALGLLAVRGADLDFTPLWRSFRPVADPRERERPPIIIPLDGSNYGKLYPPPGGATELPPPNPYPQPPPSPAVQALEDQPRREAGATEEDSKMTNKDAPPTSEHSAWIKAYEDLQRQTAEAHAAYQQSMAETHMAFLRTAEITARGLQAMITGEPIPQDVTLPAMEDLAPPLPAPPPVELPDLAPPPIMEKPDLAPPLPEEQIPPPSMDSASPLEEQAPPPAPLPEDNDAGEVTDMDFSEMLLSVVAEKTGYPVEILEMEMELESDLGIDSIKRVEILSAVQERAPWLPEVDASVVPKLQTLGQVLAMLEEFAATQSEIPAPDKAEEEAVEPEEEAADELEEEPEEEIAEDPEDEPEEEAAEEPEEEKVVEEEQIAAEEVEEEEIDRTTARFEGKGKDGGNGESKLAQDIGRFVVSEVLAPASGYSMLTRASRGRVVVTEEDSGVGRILVGKLRQLGLKVDLVQEVPPKVAAVIFLGGLRQINHVDEAIEVNCEAFFTARAVAPHFSNAGGLLVTVQDTGGDFGISGRSNEKHAWLGGLAALTRTAAREWKHAQTKAIDIDRGKRSAGELAEALFVELTQGGPEMEVGLHTDGTRTTLKDLPAEIIAPEENTAPLPVLDKKSVLVVSGGARGVTADAVVELAGQYKPRLLLLGRTPIQKEPPCCQGIEDDAGIKRALLEQAKAARESLKPVDLQQQARLILSNREVQQTLAALNEQGSEAMYYSLDVRDDQAVEEALGAAREKWGPITGIIHGAGVLSDKLIADKSPEQFMQVFDTKVKSLKTLLQATAMDPLRLICLFSSVAARHGNIGQCDYAMANEVLNHVAAAEAHCRGSACMVRSIGWGPWDGGMVTPGLADRFREMGIPLIPLKVGARMLVEELQGGTAGPSGLLISGIAAH